MKNVYLMLAQYFSRCLYSIKKRARSYFERFILLALITGFIVAGLYEAKTLQAVILIDSNAFLDQINTVFQVQASVATLGIALMALLSGFTKDTVLGMPVSQYIVKVKPALFKHNVSIYLALSLIMVSFYATTKGYYNVLGMCLTSTLVIIGLMVWDIFDVFNGSQFVLNKIKEYYLGLFDKGAEDQQNVYWGINKDIDIAQETKALQRIKINLEFLAEIFATITSRKSSHSMDSEKNTWEENYVNICKKLLNTHNDDTFVITINSVIEILAQNAKKKENKVLLSIWDKIYVEFLQELQTINPLALKRNDIFRQLHFFLYENLYFKDKELKNNFSLCRYSSSIYNFYFKAHKESSMFEMENSLERLFFYANYVYKSDEEKQKIAYDELSHFIKTMIDNLESTTISSGFKELINKTHWDEEEIKCIFTLLIYLYYLGLKENYTPDELKEFARKTITEHGQNISDFLFYVSHYNCVKSIQFIEEITRKLEPWEIFRQSEAKITIMGSVVEEFFMFYFLKLENNMDKLTELINGLVLGREFSYYNNFAGNNKESTEQNFEIFANRFFSDNKDQGSIRESVENLERILSESFKLSETKDIKELSTEEKTDVIQSLITSIFQDITNVIKTFGANKPERTLSLNIPGSIYTYTRYLSTVNEQKSASQYMIDQVVTNLFYSTVLGRIVIQNINQTDKNMLETFFKLKRESGISTDTLIGYRNWFYNIPRAEDFMLLEKSSKIVRANRLNDFVVAIDSRLLYAKLVDVKISIDSLTEEEIFNSQWEKENIKKINEENYQYRVANDIFLPFKKNELIDFIVKNRVLIKISVEIEYGYDIDTNIGVGIKITE